VLSEPIETRSATNVARDLGQILSDLRKGDINITRGGVMCASITQYIPSRSGCETVAMTKLVRSPSVYLLRVKESNEPIVLLRRGRPVASIIPVGYTRE